MAVLTPRLPSQQEMTRRQARQTGMVSYQASIRKDAGLTPPQPGAVPAANLPAFAEGGQMGTAPSAAPGMMEPPPDLSSGALFESIFNEMQGMPQPAPAMAEAAPPPQPIDPELIKEMRKAMPAPRAFKEWLAAGDDGGDDDGSVVLDIYRQYGEQAAGWLYQMVKDIAREEGVTSLPKPLQGIVKVKGEARAVTR